MTSFMSIMTVVTFCRHPNFEWLPTMPEVTDIITYVVFKTSLSVDMFSNAYMYLQWNTKRYQSFVSLKFEVIQLRRKKNVSGKRRIMTWKAKNASVNFQFRALSVKHGTGTFESFVYPLIAAVTNFSKRHMLFREKMRRIPTLETPMSWRRSRMWGSMYMEHLVDLWYSWMLTLSSGV